MFPWLLLIVRDATAGLFGRKDVAALPTPLHVLSNILLPQFAREEPGMLPGPIASCGKRLAG